MAIPHMSEIMTKKLLSVKAATPLHDAYEIMKEKRIHQLPVIDHKNRVIGMLEEKNLELVESSDAFSHAEDYVSPTHTLDEETPLRTVILYMLERQISYVLVTSKRNDIVGIVTTDDLLWHLAHLLYERQNHHSLFNADQIETIGEISRELAEMGI